MYVFSYLTIQYAPKKISFSETTVPLETNVSVMMFVKSSIKIINKHVESSHNNFYSREV